MSGVVNAMTVDVEDYFHASAFDRIVSRESWSERESRVVRNTEVLLECFERADVKATFFILGWVAERCPQLVRDIASSGHEVASHGYHHQLIYTLTLEQFREDVRRAKATIEDAGGRPVRGYRAPSFSIVHPSLWALDVLIEEGYSYDASIFPIRHDRYGIPDAPRHTHVIDRNRRKASRRKAERGESSRRSFIDGTRSIVEVPAATVRLGNRNLPIAGGGYFRLLPVRVDALGHGARQPRRRPGGVLHPPLGSRSGSAAAAGRARRPPGVTMAVWARRSIVSSGCSPTSTSTPSPRRCSSRPPTVMPDDARLAYAK